MITASIVRSLVNRKGDSSQTAIQLTDVLQRIEAAALKGESSLTVMMATTPEIVVAIGRAGFAVADDGTQLRVEW